MGALARDGCAVAQGSIGAPGHLMQAVADTLAAGGPALLRIYAPDPATSGVAPERIAELARLAVDSRAVPVFAARGALLDGNPDPDKPWTQTSLEIADASGADASVDITLTVADWAVRQARFRHHFRVVSRGHRSDRMKRLAEYLGLDAGARESIQPYIDVRDRNGHHAIALVSREMTGMVARAAQRWDRLRAVAPVAAAPDVPAAVATPAPAAAAPEPDAYRALTDNLLRMSGFGSDDPFFKRSLREFVARGRESNGDTE